MTRRLSAEIMILIGQKVTIGPSDVETWLGKPFMSDEELIAMATPGVVTGLAWTAMGGATLEIEAVAIPAEQGGFQLSGQLGDVMKESAGLARSYLRAHADRFGIDATWFDKHILHIHVPAGATLKTVHQQALPWQPPCCH